MQKTDIERKILVEESKQAMVLEREQIEKYYLEAVAADPERLI